MAQPSARFVVPSTLVGLRNHDRLGMRIVPRVDVDADLGAECGNPPTRHESATVVASGVGIWPDGRVV
jgi:hypothetical protein